MTLSKLVFKPGLNRDQTNYASEGGWFDCDKIRFRSGFPEKIGGWEVLNLSQLSGVGRSIFAWNTSDGNSLYSVGTSTNVYVGQGTNVYDITPLRITYTTSTTPDTDNCLGATSGSNEILVTLPLHGGVNGDTVTFSGVVGFAGIPTGDFNKAFIISNVTPNTFKITVATQATSTVASGGGTAIVAAFNINVGNTSVTAGYGWGTGTWGRGTWGSSSSTPVNLPARIVFMQNFNNDLIFNINYGSIYYWVYTNNFSNKGVLLSSLAGAVAVPQQVTKILFASTGHLFAFGCTGYDALAPGPDYLGAYDPLLVRWSNVDPDIGPEPENWQPTLTNNAGFFRLQSGTRIVTAVNTRQETLVWTNTALYSIQFLGTTEVFSQQQLSAATSIQGPNVAIGANNIVYWMGNDKFFTYSGRVDTLPCTLRQYVFEDINRSAGEIFLAGSNAQFNEIIWFYCSANATEIDRYVVYNYAENIWYYGQLSRTAWIDAGVAQYPMAVRNGWVYNHESGTNDGQPLGAPPLPIEAYIQSADVDIGDGEQFMLTKRIIPDVNFTGSATTDPVTGLPTMPEAIMTVGVRNFPGAVNSTTNASGVPNPRDVVTTATINQYTNQVFVRARGRQMNFRIGSDTLGTQWQLGMPRVDAKPDGRRG